MLELADATSETAFITRLIGSSAVCISLAEGKRAVRLFVSVGQELPLHGSAAARCLLAGMPRGRVLSMVSDESIAAAPSPHIHNLDELFERLDLIRQRGYEISEDELDDYAWAVAAPIVSRTGAWIASLTLTTPMLLIKQEGYAQHLIDSLSASAKEISRLLGGAD
jgi:IclR family acetate operon transcriptional repressor